MGAAGFRRAPATGKDSGRRPWVNVWNQAVVPATKDQPVRVFATEAVGTVKEFDGRGHLLKTLRPEGGYYAEMSACRMDGKTIQIIAINGNRTVAFDDTGQAAWPTSAMKDPTWRTCNFAAVTSMAMIR